MTLQKRTETGRRGKGMKGRIAVFILQFQTVPEATTQYISAGPLDIAWEPSYENQGLEHRFHVSSFQTPKHPMREQERQQV